MWKICLNTNVVFEEMLHKDRKAMSMFSAWYEVFQESSAIQGISSLEWHQEVTKFLIIFAPVVLETTGPTAFFLGKKIPWCSWIWLTSWLENLYKSDIFGLLQLRATEVQMCFLGFIVFF